MLANRSLLRNLAIAAVLNSFVVYSITDSVITATPTPTITNEPAPECTWSGRSILAFSPEAVGELGTALESASITYSVVPSVPCSALAVLPSSLQGDFAEFETSWYDWWQTKRTNFSSWASTCSGHYTGNFAVLASEYFNATSSMDNFTPRVTDCAEFTGTGTEVTSTASPGSPTGAEDGGAAETAPAGESGGGSLQRQGTLSVCVAAASFAGIIVGF